MDIETMSMEAINNGIMNIGVRLDVQDLERWLNALSKVEHKALEMIEDEMQKDCALDLSQKIYIAIKTGKYTNYVPYTDRYRAWKEQYFSGRPFWELKSDLANNLVAFSMPRAGGGRDWAAGVPDGVYDSGGKSLAYGDKFGTGHKTEIAKYGARNEKLRPLFKPETIAFSSGTWKEYGNKTLRTIGKEFN